MADQAHFFVAELLRNACSAASHTAIYRADYQLPYLDVVLADCAQGRYDEVPLIKLYFHSYRCLSEATSDEHFFISRNYYRKRRAGFLKAIYAMCCYSGSTIVSAV